MRKLSRAHRVFLTVLATIAVGYALIIVGVVTSPAPAVTTRWLPDRDFLERCRTLCLAYGLTPTGNIAEDARQYLQAANTPTPADAAGPSPTAIGFSPAETEPHVLLGQLAPDFTLADDWGNRLQLSQLNKRGPVVVVFYYGYHCSHCVAQLFGLNDALNQFRALNAEVVALSADPAEVTAARFAQYGRFEFPVLSDEHNRVAQAYDVFRPATAKQVEIQLHGTFVVGRSGKILWARTGAQPFLDNKSLLHVLRSEQDMPTDPSGQIPGFQEPPP